MLVGEDGETVGPFDEIVCATGFRPDLSLTRELRLDLDPAVEAPSALAPLIDPNVHSCGSVPPHGAEQLKHPEPDFYTVGMKSYGRAPTFLLLTGLRAGAVGRRRHRRRLGVRAQGRAGAARDRRLLHQQLE